MTSPVCSTCFIKSSSDLLAESSHPSQQSWRQSWTSRPLSFPLFTSPLLYFQSRDTGRACFISWRHILSPLWLDRLAAAKPRNYRSIWIKQDGVQMGNP